MTGALKTKTHATLMKTIKKRLKNKFKPKELQKCKSAARKHGVL